MSAKLVLSLPANPTGIASFNLEGQTVGEMIALLVAEHPSVRSHIFDEEDNLHYYLQIFHQEQQLPHQPLLSRVESGDEVFVCCAIRGG